MGLIKIVLLTESDSINRDVPLPYKYHGEKLWHNIRTVASELNYRCETVELHKLEFQEHESVSKTLNADIVIMDVTNPDRRPTFMYQKGIRESMDCMDDIVLIQASGVENDNAIQDLKTTCKIKRLIVYRYDEDKNAFYDITTPSTSSPTPLKSNLKNYLKTASANVQKGLADRYIARMNTKKSEDQDTSSYRHFLWNEICNDMFSEANQEFVTPKLITQLMYAFRDIQDYESMIQLNERCREIEIIEKKVRNNMMLSYLTAFARSRRNKSGDRDEALNILERLCTTKKTESELTNDITCLCGRIYKDKYTESSYQDFDSLNKAIEWYRRGFAADPNIYAGINLLFLLSITIEDLKQYHETYSIIIQLNALLGKKGRSLKDLNDYWDVATYFELHAVQREWTKACQAALHMYLLNPPIWYLKSTVNNLKILHQATLIRDNQKQREQTNTKTSSVSEEVYSFWIDFFNDAIDSTSTSTQTTALPAQMPILICDNFERKDGTALKNIYVEAYLQLNFHTGTDPETLVIRILEQRERMGEGDSVKTIGMDSIRSIVNVKRDNRSVFLYAYENSEEFSSVEAQIFFSSAERRIAFNEKMSKYRVETITAEVDKEFDLEFERDAHGQRIALGQGTYGKVYVAQDRNTWKKFAVKEIPMRNPAYTDVLENEIKILSTLNHKNIVSYHGTAIDRTKKTPVFQVIMEYVDGGSLSKFISRFGQFSEASIRAYTRQILEGVQYLHENHILHRDIKSANILVNSKGEIKIADFGTSKRLAGLHLCTEDSVGTLQYMSPDVVLVPPMGYGPEVDIWSVGCTVIEMATGKKPFHSIPNPCALMLKLGNERQPPEIPQDLSENAKDFLIKSFESTGKHISAKDLLNHPFIKTKGGLPRETSSGTPHVRLERPPSQPDRLSDNKNHIDSGGIRVSASTASFNRGISEENGVLEPARSLEAQVSIDDRRRSELIGLLRDPDGREVLISEWMDLIDSKSQTELITIEKLLILLSGIIEYLEDLNVRSLQDALDKICDESLMDSDSRTDLERSFYFFISATNTMLSKNNGPPPHVLFALDNIIRRVTEHLVGLIRPDFIPAVALTPLTPGDHTSPSFGARTASIVHTDSLTNDEITRLHLEYTKLTETNKVQLRRLIDLENNTGKKLTELLEREPSSRTVGLFLPVEHSPVLSDSTTSSNLSVPSPDNRIVRSDSVTSRTQALVNIEREHEQLLKALADNRVRLNTLLNSS